MSLRVFFIILFTISYMFGQKEFNIRQLRYIDDTYNVKGQSKPVSNISTTIMILVELFAAACFIASLTDR